jgi:hypothetical protein
MAAQADREAMALRHSPAAREAQEQQAAQAALLLAQD